MTWWGWTVLGLVLLAVELVTPGGFFALFFGLSALLVGALEGVGMPLLPWVQWCLFSLFALVALGLFRRPLLRLMEPNGAHGGVDRMTREIAVLLDDIAPGATGKAELRGTSWSARNDDQRELRRGERAQVLRVDGLTLWLRAETSAGGDQ